MQNEDETEVKDKSMKKWILLVLLGAALATTLTGCKKGG
jgi:hypothetical protein